MASSTSSTCSILRPSLEVAQSGMSLRDTLRLRSWSQVLRSIMMAPITPLAAAIPLNSIGIRRLARLVCSTILSRLSMPSSSTTSTNLVRKFGRDMRMIFGAPSSASTSHWPRPRNRSLTLPTTSRTRVSSSGIIMIIVLTLSKYTVHSTPSQQMYSCGTT